MSKKRKEEKVKAPHLRVVRPSNRGFRGVGEGYSGVISVPQEWRGTTVQVCGLWPFAAGSGSPMVGVPLGRHLATQATVCCDPISWFQRAHLLSNPSCFVLGKPGLGKSTVVRRMCTGLAGFGVMPMILGDLKPDYVDLIEALEGQVVRLGRGLGHINPLDGSSARRAAEKLPEKLANEIISDSHSRRLQVILALIQIIRQAPIADREESILDRAILTLDRAFSDPDARQPVISDLLQVIREAPDDVRQVALDRGDINRYKEITEALEVSLMALAGNGRLGEVFSEPTEVRMRLDRPVVFDLSAIPEAEADLSAAALLATWSLGFGEINVAGALAEAGLAPQRHYFVVMDELWRALRAGRGMVDRVDSLTRLNRTYGVGQALITHTMSDLESLETEEDRAKARGFVERSGMVICGGLPSSEMPLLNRAIRISEAERAMLTSWQDPPAWDQVKGREAAPPGRGKFLIKVGSRPGIPVDVVLTESERNINDTNQKWKELSRVGASEYGRG